MQEADPPRRAARRGTWRPGATSASRTPARPATAAPPTAPTGQAHEVPPAGPVGDRAQRAAGLPDRALHRLLVAAQDRRRRPERGAGQQRGHPQLGAVPRHARVVPGHQCQPGPVGRHGGRRHEVRAGPEHHHLPGAVQRDGDQLVHDPLAGLLAHAQQVRPARQELRLGVPVDRTGVGRQRSGGAALDQPEPLVGEVAGHERVAEREPAGPAVLVHPGARVEPGRQDLLDGPVAGPAQDGRAAALGRAGLGPPHGAAAVGHRDLPVRRGAGRDLRGGQGTRPAAAGLGWCLARHPRSVARGRRHLGWTG